MDDSTEPSGDQIAFVLSRINSGLTQTWSQINELAISLDRMLKDVRGFGERRIPAERRAAWDESWRVLRTSFDGIRACDAEAQKRFNSGDASSNPLEPWHEVLAREEGFNHSLSEIRKIADEFISGPDGVVWNDFCQGIERQIAMLEAHAITIRFQLELRAKYGNEKADALTREIATRMPKGAGPIDAKRYATEYRKAWTEFKQEQQTFGGVWDMLKGLMLIQPKTAEERVADTQPPQRLQRPPV